MTNKLINPIIEYIVFDQSMFCRCALDKNNYILDNYDQNCLHERIFKDLEKMSNSLRNNIVVYMIGHNTKLIRDLHYSYAYRKQNNYPLPDNVGPLVNNINVRKYLEYLIVEYFQNMEQYTIDVYPPMVNPMQQYAKNICFKNPHGYIFPKNILVLPHIS